MVFYSFFRQVKENLIISVFGAISVIVVLVSIGIVLFTNNRNQSIVFQPEDNNRNRIEEFDNISEAPVNNPVTERIIEKLSDNSENSDNIKVVDLNLKIVSNQIIEKLVADPLNDQQSAYNNLLYSEIKAAAYPRSRGRAGILEESTKAYKPSSQPYYILGKWLKCDGSMFEVLQDGIKNNPDFMGYGKELSDCYVGPKESSLVARLYIPQLQKSAVVDEYGSGILFDGVDMPVFSPRGNGYSYKAWSNGDWYVVTDRFPSRAFAYVGDIFYSKDGIRYVLVKNFDNTWTLLKGEREYQTYGYIDSLLLLPWSKDIVFRAKQCVDEQCQKESWHIVFGKIQTSAWDYIDQLVPYENGILFRARDEQGRWNVVSVDKSGRENVLYTSSKDTMFTYFVPRTDIIDAKQLKIINMFPGNLLTPQHKLRYDLAYSDNNYYYFVDKEDTVFSSYINDIDYFLLNGRYHTSFTTVTRWDKFVIFIDAIKALEFDNIDSASRIGSKDQGKFLIDSSFDEKGRLVIYYRERDELRKNIYELDINYVK